MDQTNMSTLPFPHSTKVIAIDGPSASGKGTIAARIASILNRDYLDSGALYRLTALFAQQRQIDWTNEEQIAQLAAALPVIFIEGKILLNDLDVTHIIRSEEVGMNASKIAVYPLVRAALLQRQRGFLTARGLVADGRDMASVVFPSAELKIFLTASAQIRAERRALQLGISVNSDEFKQILADIEKRDTADRTRLVAPLQPVADAHILDTSSLNIEESVQKILDWYQIIEK
ncbi:Cytidylate kinase [Snodgrassella alvi SCGC AB-598-O02]|nr:Cytidylate kinase [Snodgrassella alvi SCGC AB-598-O02]